MAAESRFNCSTWSPAIIAFIPARDAFLAWLLDLSELLRVLGFGAFFTSIPPIRSVDELADFGFMETPAVRRLPGFSPCYSSMRFGKPLKAITALQQRGRTLVAAVIH
jgi:hypothetical protein